MESAEKQDKTKPDLNVSKEFIEENRAVAVIKKYAKRGGPYTKDDKESRRNEVYRLHFEYGYSARKIAELMKVNRNTINGDIQYWYVRIIKNTNVINPEDLLIANIERLEIQRTRLREQLDKTSSAAEKITIERLILDIDYKILHTYQRISESFVKIHAMATDWLNNHIKKEKKDERYITFFDTINVSEKARQRIKQIINEDRSKGHFR